LVVSVQGGIREAAEGDQRDEEVAKEGPQEVNPQRNRRLPITAKFAYLPFPGMGGSSGEKNKAGRLAQGRFCLQPDLSRQALGRTFADTNDPVGRKCQNGETQKGRRQEGHSAHQGPDEDHLFLQTVKNQKFGEKCSHFFFCFVIVFICVHL